MDEVSQLGKFVAAFDRFPARALKLARLGFLDWFGVALAGSRWPAARILSDWARDAAEKAVSTVVGRGFKTSPDRAALLNGTFAHILDFDDTHPEVILHTSAPLCAALLAAAEPAGADGRRVLEAYVVGFEAGVRVARALWPSHYERGWHMTGTAGSMAAAAAVSRLLGLDAQKTAVALSLAATQAGGLRASFGTMAKSLHAGRAAANGVVSAQLAAWGFTAPSDGLTGRLGYLAVTAEAGGNPAALAAGLGERWEIEANSFKPFACGLVTHPTIQAVLQLRAELGGGVERPERIRARVNPLVLELTGTPRPETGLEAKFSIYYAAAVAWVDGKAGEAQFTDEAVRRPEVRALLERVQVEADGNLKPDEAVVEITLADGRGLRRVVRGQKGTPANPMTEAELAAKFLDLASPVLGPGRAHELLAALGEFESLGDVSVLLRLAAGQDG